MSRVSSEDSQCGAKERFTSMHAAKRAAMAQSGRRSKPPLDAYACPHCGGYHTGNAQKKRLKLTRHRQMLT